MIFVTIGSSKYPFRRLLETMDKLASKLGVEVMMQIGYNNYKPSFCNYVDFLSQEEFERMVSKAKIVVSHGGLGTIMTAIKMGKQIIVTTHSTILPVALSRMVRKAKEEKLCKDPNELIAIYEITKNKDEGTRERRLLLNNRGYMKEYMSSFYKVEKELLDEWWESLPSEEITIEE